MSFDKIWEKIFKNNEWGKYPGEELIRFVAKNFYSRSNANEITILEVGCGPGANLWYCAREGFTIFGIDGSNTAIKNCKTRLDDEVPGWNGELTVGDINKLPYENKKFDLVIDNECLSCNSISNSKKIILEIKRVLKTDGLFYSRTFSTDTWGYKTGQHIDKNSFLPSEGPLFKKGLIRFTDKKDLDLLYSNNFELISIEKIQRTMMNQQQKISEWIIEAKNK